MKKILIAGANSYIGTSFEKHMSNWPDDYEVHTLDMLSDNWRDGFKGYDIVFHVAGIAHRKETEENAHLYYEVNRDMAIEAATIAKAAGVKQYIYLSSMSIYGKNMGVITPDTLPDPKSHYGLSKLEAEHGLIKLDSDSFKVMLVRPPMVYGNGCKGNFQTVVKIVKALPVFPRIKNKRSMIYIDNLCEFIKLVIDENIGGIGYPQNSTYVNTTDMAREIARAYGKNIYCSYLMGFAVDVGKIFVPTLQKAFGTLVYEDTEKYDYKYCLVNSLAAIVKSVTPTLISGDKENK